MQLRVMLPGATSLAELRTSAPAPSNDAEISAATTKAARQIAAKRLAIYTSFGAALALSLGPTAWDWAMGDLSSNQASYRLIRALSLLGTGVGTEILLQNAWRGALRGGVRGNLIFGTAVTVTEAVWLLSEHGWRRAFYQPQFYEQFFGGVSALGLGLAGGVGATILAAETGPAAPVIGTAVGFVTGTIGYVGGRYTTHLALEWLSPEMLRQQERQKIAEVKALTEQKINEAQAWRLK